MLPEGIHQEILKMITISFKIFKLIKLSWKNLIKWYLELLNGNKIKENNLFMVIEKLIIQKLVMIRKDFVIQWKIRKHQNNKLDREKNKLIHLVMVKNSENFMFLWEDIKLKANLIESTPNLLKLQQNLITLLLYYNVIS